MNYFQPVQHSVEGSKGVLTLQSNRWDSEGLLKSIALNKIHLTAAEKKVYEQMFWHSICTEYDSQNFYKNLIKSKLAITIEFKEFLKIWLRDEINHANGFKLLYGLIYNRDEESINDELESRVIDFSCIDSFFKDEFKLCLLLAYDEIVTTHVYSRSIKFYDSLGPKELGIWIRQIKRDEALHFSNLISIIKNNYSDRTQDAESILNSIVTLDMNIKNYNGTFVLDHSCPEFPLTNDELYLLCVNAILKKLMN